MERQRERETERVGERGNKVHTVCTSRLGHSIKSQVL